MYDGNRYFEIWAQPRDKSTPAECVDGPTDAADAQYLVNEYALAYGPTFRVWRKRVAAAGEFDETAHFYASL